MISNEYISKMREIYQATERQFLEFNEVVPFETNEWSVNSPKLYFILLTTCGQIESLMKKISNNLNIKLEKEDFPNYYEKINQKKVLSKQTIVLIKTEKIIHPFFEDSSDHFWWISHNKAKHELPEGILHGTINNVIHALAALFALHNVIGHIPVENPTMILESKYWETHEPIRVSETLTRPRRYYNPGDSKLFISHTHYYGGPGL